MTLEATAGKNPITHTGKLYNLSANEISRELANDADIFEADCYLVSQIEKAHHGTTTGTCKNPFESCKKAAEENAWAS